MRPELGRPAWRVPALRAAAGVALALAGGGVRMQAGPVGAQGVKTGLPWGEAPYWAMPDQERRRRLVAGVVGLAMGACLGGLVVGLWLL